MKNSVVMIIDKDNAPIINAIAEGFGYGPGTLSVPLSATGSEPATHYGSQAPETPGTLFHQLRVAVQAKVTPPGLEAQASALSALYVRVIEDSDDAQVNWLAALAETGLHVIRPATSLIGE